jgi:hypothetical protein
VPSSGGQTVQDRLRLLDSEEIGTGVLRNIDNY